MARPCDFSLETFSLPVLATTATVTRMSHVRYTVLFISDEKPFNYRANYILTMETVPYR